MSACGMNPYIKAARMREGLDLINYAACFPSARGFLLDAFVEGYGGGGRSSTGS